MCCSPAVSVPVYDSSGYITVFYPSVLFYVFLFLDQLFNADMGDGHLYKIVFQNKCSFLTTGTFTYICYRLNVEAFNYQLNTTMQKMVYAKFSWTKMYTLSCAKTPNAFVSFLLIYK